MTTVRAKYTYLCVGFVLIVAFGIVLAPKYARLKLKLTNEFELSLKGASLTFVESVNRHITFFDQNLDDAVSRLQQALIDQASELDGYLSRISQGESDVIVKVSKIFEAAYEENITPAIVEFRESYEEELAKLEDGLLIDLNASLSLDSVQNGFRELEEATSKITDILRSPEGFIMKVLDDSFEWVPIAGDIWGFLKIVYDPRKEHMKNQIVEITEVLESSLKQRFEKCRTLTACHVEKVCKDSYDGNYAVMKYLYLTYIRR